jgi:hypothetical protein
MPLANGIAEIMQFMRAKANPAGLVRLSNALLDLVVTWRARQDRGAAAVPLTT